MPHLYGHVLDFGCGAGFLAEHVPPDRYVGYDINPVPLHKARAAFPAYEFTDTLPEGPFGSIAAVAVLEHLKDPDSTMVDLATRLTADGRIVATTPHPRFEWLHTVGGRTGLVASHAHDAHEQLLDRERLSEIGREAGLELRTYRRFLAGMNQLAVWYRDKLA